MARIRVLVADEQTMFREGLCALLRTRGDIEVVGEATDGHEAVAMAQAKLPDLVLMNMSIPGLDGAEVTHRVRKESSETKVLLLTQCEDRDRILSGLKAGASGYIPKKASAADLVSAMQVVCRGGYFLYPSIARAVVDDYSQLVKRAGSADPYEKLTHREREVLKLLAEGRKSREIAEMLEIATKTVIRHKTSMMSKLGVHNRTDLIKYAIRKHLVELER
ncbi:MAG: response regulator transcription factor [Chloroflexi bacterium]|nr:response regulator transcription factor [Chloroflexota bacterium]